MSRLSFLPARWRSWEIFSASVPGALPRLGEGFFESDHLLFAPLQAAERRLDLLVHAQNILDAAVIFALETLDLGETVFDLFKCPRIEVHALGVAAQRRGRLLELRQGRLEQFDGRL